jgi:GntR family transcriptional regulator, galactonate operon transcriptional repressor
MATGRAESGAESRAEGGGRVHNAVLRTIGASILGGTYGPGDALPREHELAAQFGVSRSSVREAVRVLCAKGLLQAGPRVGVRVRPRDAWQMLDPTVLSWHPDIRREPELLPSLLEARRIIEPPAAALAARHATAADLAAIEAACLGMARAIPDDMAACSEADLAFHAGVIAASHNLVLKGLIGAMTAMLRPLFDITNRLMAPPLIASESQALLLHREVLDRIRLRDEAGARDAMARLLDIAEDDLRK